MYKVARHRYSIKTVWRQPEERKKNSRKNPTHAHAQWTGNNIKMEIALIRSFQIWPMYKVARHRYSIKTVWWQPEEEPHAHALRTGNNNNMEIALIWSFKFDPCTKWPDMSCHIPWYVRYRPPCAMARKIPTTACHRNVESIQKQPTNIEETIYNPN